jgi:hypothetical protein
MLVRKPQRTAKRPAPRVEPTASGMLSVFSGKTCVGFLIRRSAAAFEGFDASGASLGLFDGLAAGAAAVGYQHDQGGK